MSSGSEFTGGQPAAQVREWDALATSGAVVALDFVALEPFGNELRGRLGGPEWLHVDGEAIGREDEDGFAFHKGTP